MEIQKHHINSEPCSTRPKYREGKIPRSVKVYSIVNESKYLLVCNVPTLNVVSELVKLFSIYGTVEDNKVLHEYPTSDEFHEVVLIKFLKIQNARCAKIKLDKHNFYGSSLHVCYVPEYEDLNDLREKLNERQALVEIKCKKYESMGYGTLKNDMKPKESFLGKKKQKKFKEIKKEELKEEIKSEPTMVMYPQMPENWKKQTYTGDASYDETVNEISKQLKRTMPSYEPLEKVKKRKKTLQL